MPNVPGGKRGWWDRKVARANLDGKLGQTLLQEAWLWFGGEGLNGARVIGTHCITESSMEDTTLWPGSKNPCSTFGVLQRAVDLQLPRYPAPSEP